MYKLSFIAVIVWNYVKVYSQGANQELHKIILPVRMNGISDSKDHSVGQKLATFHSDRRTRGLSRHQLYRMGKRRQVLQRWPNSEMTLGKKLN